jgi:Domain of unknown function (DUF4190)
MTEPQQPSGWSDPTWQQPTPPVSPVQPDQPGYAIQPTYQAPTYPQASYPQGDYTQPYAQSPYGTAAYAGPGTNSLAIASLICSLAGLIVGISAPVGAILGHMARKQIRTSGEQGDGMALAGIIVGWSLTGIFLCLCGVWAVFLSSVVTAGVNQ